MDLRPTRVLLDTLQVVHIRRVLTDQLLTLHHRQRRQRPPIRTPNLLQHTTLQLTLLLQR